MTKFIEFNGELVHVDQIRKFIRKNGITLVGIKESTTEKFVTVEQREKRFQELKKLLCGGDE